MSTERPFTHTQYKDGDGTHLCARGEHDFIPLDPNADMGDEDFDGQVICRYCGHDGSDDGAVAP